MNSSQGPLYKFPFLPIFIFVSPSFLIQLLAFKFLSPFPNLDSLAWPCCSKWRFGFEATERFLAGGDQTRCVREGIFLSCVQTF